VQTVNIRTLGSSLSCLAIVLVIGAVLTGCGNNETGEAQTVPSYQSEVQPTPTLFVLGPLIDEGIDLRAGPVEVPLELQIPSLKVNAPMLGVGLTPDNVMDSPKGPIGDPVWGTAFWYRGGGIPGDIGTATIAGHVDDPLGRPEIFAHLEKLQPGDLIIVHLQNTGIDIHFTVNQVKVYSLPQSSDPAVLAQIYGAGAVAGTGPKPAPDGLSHLTLVTCAGYIVKGKFDHHTVVYATRTK
jgi:Sortase domain